MTSRIDVGELRVVIELVEIRHTLFRRFLALEQPAAAGDEQAQTQHEEERDGLHRWMLKKGLKLSGTELTGNLRSQGDFICALVERDGLNPVRRSKRPLGTEKHRRAAWKIVLIIRDATTTHSVIHAEAIHHLLKRHVRRDHTKVGCGAG